MDLIVNLVVIEDLQPSLCEVVGGVRLRHVEEGNIKPLHLPVFVDEVGSHDDVRIICRSLCMLCTKYIDYFLFSFSFPQCLSTPTPVNLKLPRSTLYTKIPSSSGSVL